MNDAVLIVDDSMTVRMDLADALSEAGFQSVLCATLAEARQALAVHAPRALILDVLLPDGDGVDLLREIRGASSGPHPVVLMLSTEAEVKDRARGLTTGADEYVGKPYDTGYVVARVAELLRKGPVEPSLKATILLIDDSVTFREALRLVLEDAAYRVLSSGSGEEGLRIAGAQRPDAVIVDGVLPGIDGATVIRRIRLDSALRNLPCILLTASGEGDAELRALDVGADAFLQKEGDSDVILAKLAAILRRTERPAGESLTSALGPKKILAVDDSETYLEALADELRGEGYDVVLARSGLEAIDLLAVQPVDCILLDLVMPGLSGEETCRRIKAAPAVRDTPLILLTALDERETMIRGLSAGADDYVQKSSEFAVLKARMRAQIRRKQFEDDNRRIRERLLRKEIEAAEARAARELAAARAVLIDELERQNAELEAFSYSVSHDLRAPLRSIDGFSAMVLADCADLLPPKGQDYLRRVRRATQRMSDLIDALLELSRLGRMELKLCRVDLSSLARSVIESLVVDEPERAVEFSVDDACVVDADKSLMRVVLDNLIGNAWKFTAKTARAEIQCGTTERDGRIAFFVRDNGAGFDMTYADKLFRPFQRLHPVTDFAGTGIGLATVNRVIRRHGGLVWAESVPGQGATFYFTLASPGLSSHGVTNGAARAERHAGVPDAPRKSSGPFTPLDTAAPLRSDRR